MMSRIKLSFTILIIGLSLLWLFADTLLPTPFTYFSFRSVFVQYTGIISIATMSIAMLLAIRPIWMERPLNGLDKMYRLHKWLGITGLLFAVTHWWFAKGTKWMVGWGWLNKPERRNQGRQLFSQSEQWLRSQRDLAETLGEWAFYATVILIALALIKRFPYHLFKKTHHLLAITYLILAFHSIVLTKFSYWSQPIGWVMLLLILSGIVSAFLVLVGRVGAGRKVQGVIESLHYYPDVKVVEGSTKVDANWPGHIPGQFAFVTSNIHEGAHPYTIASAWDPKKRQLTFISKGLGDWTNQLSKLLEVGMPITIEGPYGCFDFIDNHDRQIWIGAGIGITPFIARMKHLAKAPGGKQIDLFHSTSAYDQGAIEKLTADAKAANVKLHLIVTSKDALLTQDQIRAVVPDWKSASIWFCGPNAFGKSLRKDFLCNGLSAQNFHQELFEMR